MEESDLLKERLQAITEKRRVQEDIRQKKQELDREKLKLKHLKKTALREQWLLEDSASHNALQQRQNSLLADQQQTRILQSNIHRIEKEVESLEREESMISTNERFILLRLKAVEKSPEEIIKEAQENFIPEPIQYITATPDQPQSLSLSANGHANPSRQTLFAMEINVSKNLLTGESKVVSTATVTPQELSHCSGVKVYDDGRKCVFALEANRGSHDMGGNVSELSPSEVEQLLRDATQHRRGNHRQNGKGEGHHYNNQHDSHRHGNHDLRNNQWEEDGYFSNHQHHSCDQESCYRSQKDNVFDQGHHHRNQQWVGPGFRRQEDDHSVYHQERNGHRNQCEDYRGKRSSINSVVRSVSERSPRAIVCPRPPPRAHNPEVAVPAYHPELSYTPANHIPLSDYVSVEEEELYVYKPPPYQPERGGLHHRDVKSASAALFYDPRGSARGPSPLCEADAPYRILDAMDTTEPITAVFLGFQTSQDESDQEYDGSIKAELVVIGDDDDYDEYVYGEKMLQEQEKPSQTEANGEAWQEDMASDRRKPVTAVQLWIEEELII